MQEQCDIQRGENTTESHKLQSRNHEVRKIKIKRSKDEGMNTNSMDSRNEEVRSPDSLVKNKVYISEENSEYTPPSQNVVNKNKATKIPLKVKIKRVENESLPRDDSFEPMVKLVDSLE